ncbi:MAG TPA: bifunctional 4-hydroxy-2-oxoglutarate aldolase/2-dehydro-3-deoxy-phosphogluconate aldolase, partial [Armatimonadota bacterium]|nr:bifunctional 4-hydroxy-2-oxoglutarate aldolase/2-dehydro-3-deoxy-phosphogluconate aldolase [Armatimonadota bacterium]
MNGLFNWDAFTTVPLVGIVRGFSADTACELARAAQRGGLTTLEITMNTPGAADIIAMLRDDDLGDTLNIGAGTVCSLDDLTRARKAGAEFIVTPVMIPDVIQACKDAGLPIFPGAYTPTEIYQAWSLGADIVKIFPADQL